MTNDLILKMIDKENDYKCYYNLYNQELFALQRKLQQKKMTIDEYNSQSQELVKNVNKYKKELLKLTTDINKEIKKLKNIDSVDIEDWIFENS